MSAQFNKFVGGVIAFKKLTHSLGLVKFQKEIKPKAPPKVISDSTGNKRAQWLTGNIAHVIKDDNHIGVNGVPLTPEEKAHLVDQGNRRLANAPKSTKTNSSAKPPRSFLEAVHAEPSTRSSAEKDVIEQLTNEYAFSPAAIAKNKKPGALPRINDIPGNSELPLKDQKTFGQSLEDYTQGDGEYFAGSGVFTLHGKQYLPGQNIPKEEIEKLKIKNPEAFKKLTSVGDHLPGGLTKNRDAAKIIGNSKSKLVPKGKTTHARLFTTSPNIGDDLPYGRDPATLPANIDKLFPDPKSISHEDLKKVFSKDHIALKVLTTPDMRMTLNALKNGINAYNSAHSNELRAGASAIGVTKKQWYLDSAKLFHGMFGLHDNGHGPDHEDNRPIAIAKKAQAAFTDWEKSPSKPKSSFLTSAIASGRFCGVLAATSPGVSVKSNLVVALHIWDAWEEYQEKVQDADLKDYTAFVKWVRLNKTAPLALTKGGDDEGEDEGPKPLADWIMMSEPGEVDGEDSVFGNSVRSALTGDEKKVLGLGTPLFEGGPKIENFRLACWGLADRAVLDVWESYAAGIPQSRFSQKISDNDPNLYTDADYKFLAAGFIEQADLLNDIQVSASHPSSKYYNSDKGKKPWEAADIQASGWCGLKGIIEYSAFKGMTLMQALHNMTVEDMDSVEEFSNIGKEILHGNSTQEIGLAAFMEKTQSRHANSENVTSTGGQSDVKTKTLKELIDTIKKGGVDRKTKIVDLIPQQLLPHAEKFLNRMSVNLGSGATAAFMAKAGNALDIPKQGKFKKSGKPIKFAQFKPAPGGMTGAPVATRTNQPFSNAVAKSPGGKNLAQGALGNQINAKGGVETTAQNAVGDWPNGSEESIVHTAPQGTDPNRLKYLAAWHGISGQKKSVLVFHPNPKGPDSLYHIDHPSTDMGEVREQLLAAGIGYKTLLPGKKSTRVTVFDPLRRLRNNVDQFATKNNLNVEENIGQGEIVGHNGDWNSAGALPKSRQAYQNIIGAYEQNSNQTGNANNTSGPPTNGTSPSAGKAQQLSRKTTAKTKIKFDRSRRILEGFLRQHNTPNKELPPVGDLLSQDLQQIKPEHLSKYQQLIPDAKWSDIEGAVNSLQQDPSLYDDMTSESNRREMYCKEHARTVLQSSGLKKLIDSLQVQKVIPEHAQHLIEDAKDGDYFSLEAISAELEHGVPSLRAFAKAAEKEYNKAGKVWDKMRTQPQPQKFAKKSAHAANQYRAGVHGVTFRGRNYNGGQFAPKDDGVKRFEKDSNLTHMIKKLRGA